MIKPYYEFILESVLLTSIKFKGIISSICDDFDDPIAYKLSYLIGKDIKTDYNILDLSDNNDKVSFISDKQASRKLDNGSSVDELFKKNNNKILIGRISKSILDSNNVKYTPVQIEKFVDRFKSMCDRINNKFGDIRIVSGEDIRYWYLENRYVTTSEGTIGKSCMRHSECQDYLDIYVKNPQVCSLLVHLDNDKLLSRALLWNTDSGKKYLDRVYYTKKSDEYIINDWIFENFGSDVVYFGENQKISVQLGDHTYYKYPYMDSFHYYNINTFILYNHPPNLESKRGLILLQNTDGSYTRQDKVISEYEGVEYYEDQVIWSDFFNSYIGKDNTIYCKHFKCLIVKYMSFYCKVIDDYLPCEHCTKVYTSVDKKNYEYYPNFEPYTSEYEYVNYGYYINDLIDIITIDGYKEYALKGTYLFTKKIEQTDENSKKAKELYNIKDITDLFLDENDYIYGFKFTNEKSYSSKNHYYGVIYRRCFYKKIKSITQSLKCDKKLIELKLEQIEEANNYLSEDLSYSRINKFHDEFKSIEDAVNWLIKEGEKYFDRAFQYGNRIIKGDLIKEQIKHLCLKDIVKIYKLYQYGGEKIYDELKNFIMISYQMAGVNRLDGVSIINYVDKHFVNSFVSSCIRINRKILELIYTNNPSMEEKCDIFLSTLTYLCI